MAVHYLGIVAVPTPGTPVRATSNLPDPAKRLGCKSIMFITKKTNVGSVYVGDDDLNKALAHTDGAGKCVEIPKPPTATDLNSFSVTIDSAPGPLNACDFWIDADTANDGVRVVVVCL